MDKIRINNQIVLMRKFVKQAKVHTINRLVKQIKHLQQRKGDETQVLKAKRKADRFLEEVAVLKKIKPDDVSKLALSKAKDWSAILQQKNAALLDRCLAMLANYESVQKEVEQFCNKNQYLVFQIPIFLKEWNCKSKNSINKERQKCKANELRLKKEKFHNRTQVKNDISSTQNHDISPQNIELVDRDTGLLPLITKKQISNMRESKELSSTEVNQINDVSELGCRDDKIQHIVSDGKASNELEILTMKKPCSVNNICQQKSSIFSTFPNINRGTEVLHKTNNQEEKAISNIYINSENEFSTEKNFVDTQTEFNLEPKLNLEKEKSEKSLKAVAILNLEELQGLDEIPINKFSDQEENSEDEPEIMKSDNFFLGIHRTPEVFENDSDKRGEKVLWNKSPYVPSTLEHSKRENSYLRKKDFNSSYHPKKNYDFRNERAHFKTKERDGYHNTDRKNFGVKNTWIGSSKAFGSNRSTHHKEFQPKNSAERSFCKDKQKFSVKKSKKDDLPLHPSWEAKRKLKEIAHTSVKAKRIVFDD